MVRLLCFCLYPQCRSLVTPRGSLGCPCCTAFREYLQNSILGDIQKPSGHSPRQPAVGGPGCVGWLEEMTFQPQPLCDSVNSVAWHLCIHKARTHVSTKAVQSASPLTRHHVQPCGPHLQPTARALPGSFAICTCHRNGTGEHRVIPAGKQVMNCDKYKARTKWRQRIGQLAKEDCPAGKVSGCRPLLFEVWLHFKE